MNTNKWETPSEYQARTGKPVSPNQKIFTLAKITRNISRPNQFNIEWVSDYYRPALSSWDMVIDEGHGKPPDSWRIGDEK